MSAEQPETLSPEFAELAKVADAVACDRVVLELTIGEVETILGFLGLGTYVEVADLIEAIRRQAAPQLENASTRQALALCPISELGRA